MKIYPKKPRSKHRAPYMNHKTYANRHDEQALLKGMIELLEEQGYRVIKVNGIDEGTQCTTVLQ